MKEKSKTRKFIVSKKNKLSLKTFLLHRIAFFLVVLFGIFNEQSLFNESFFFFLFQIEDEGKHGNDDTRMFVLSSLAAHKKTHMSCILCKEMMLVYDRYPLVDGTFFLSPIQHSKECIEVRHEICLWSKEKNP